MTGRPGDRAAVTRRRAEQITLFLTDAERSLAADDLDAAIAASEEVLVRDAEHEGALALLDRIKTIFDEREAAAVGQRAEMCAEEARSRFAEGRHDQAFVLLERFEPPHPTAREVLGALRAEAARLEHEQLEQERLERERQAELERQGLAAEALRQRLAAELEAIRSDMREGELDAALERIGAVEQDEAAITVVAAAAAEVRALRAGVEAAIAEAERGEALVRAVSEHVARAAGMFARRDYAGALARLDSALALDPSSAAALSLRSRVASAHHEAARRQAPERASAPSEPETTMTVAVPVPRGNCLEFPDYAAALDLFASEDEMHVPSRPSVPPTPPSGVPPAVRTAVTRDVRSAAARPVAGGTRTAVGVPAVLALVGALALAAAMWAAFRPTAPPPPAAAAPAAPDGPSSTIAVPDVVPAPVAAMSRAAAPSPAPASAPTSSADEARRSSGRTPTQPAVAARRPAEIPLARVGVAPVPSRAETSIPVNPPAQALRAPQSVAPSLTAPAAASSDPPAVSQAAAAVSVPPATATLAAAPAPGRTAALALPGISEPGAGGPDAREATPDRRVDSEQDDERAVRATLAAYAAAYSGLEVEGVKRVFPSVDEPGLRRAFGTLRSQQVEIRDQQMAVAGDAATVSCTLVASAIGQVGAGLPQRDSRRVVFNLVKRNGSWVIIDRR